MSSSNGNDNQKVPADSASARSARWQSSSSGGTTASAGTSGMTSEENSNGGSTEMLMKRQRQEAGKEGAVPKDNADESYSKRLRVDSPSATAKASGDDASSKEDKSKVDARGGAPAIDGVSEIGRQLQVPAGAQTMASQQAPQPAQPPQQDLNQYMAAAAAHQMFYNNLLLAGSQQPLSRTLGGGAQVPSTRLEEQKQGEPWNEHPVGPPTLPTQQQIQLARLANLQRGVPLNLPLNIYSQSLPASFGASQSNTLPSRSLGTAVQYGKDPPPSAGVAFFAANQIPTSAPPRPEGTSNQRRMSLYMTCDDDVLAENQVLLRRQLEFFEAQTVDVETVTSGRRKSIRLGQVGIRCRHCAHLPIRIRKRAAVYYPSKLKSIYQAAQNMNVSHLCDVCDQIDPLTKLQLISFQQARSTTGHGGKEYWAGTAHAQGLIETEESGLRFQNEAAEDDSETNN